MERRPDISYREIVRLTFADGHYTLREIAASAGCSHGTVGTVQRKLKTLGIDAETLLGMSERELRVLVNDGPGRKEGAGYKRPDFEKIHQELSRDRKLPMTILWEEYAEEAVREGKRPYMYSFFLEQYRKWEKATNPTVERPHRPGDEMEVDWAGDTMELVDPFTGEVSKVYLFVATLPFSQYTYVKPALSMKSESWIECNVAALRFFGGAPRIVIPDNLKTGVTKNAGGEVVLNRTYREFGEHYGTAIIPADVGKPKQKPSVEGSVGKIGERIIKMLRHRRFIDFDDLCDAVADKLAELNARPFNKRAGSRLSVFIEMEKPLLSPLPVEDFEAADWVVRTVGRDYAVSVLGVAYSVPYQYVKRQVDVRIGMRTVSVFCDGERIAMHARSFDKGEAVVDESHRPAWHVEYLNRSAGHYRQRALDEIGPCAKRVVDSILEAGRAEEEGYRSCAALLKLARKNGAEAVELACERACAITARPSLKTVKILLKKAEGPEGDPVAKAMKDYALLRDEEYYPTHIKKLSASSKTTEKGGAARAADKEN